MTETVVVTDENTGFRFAWGLAFAGGVAAMAVTLVLLALGSGFGLLLVNPVRHTGPSLPAFLTAGAIYFFAAQAFGFAVGGHLAGRLLGALPETRGQEELRAGAHGLVSWAVAILGTIAIVALMGLAASGGANAIGALYGLRGSQNTTATPAAYAVDVLFRPERGGSRAQVRAYRASSGDETAHAEAERIVQAATLRGGTIPPEDRARLSDLVSAQAAIGADEAMSRVDAMQAEARSRLDNARRAASYAALWMAVSLIFGAVVAIFSAISARLEDDFATWRKGAGNAPGAILFGFRRD
ncbi:MAG TPA: hypothetical protein VKR31_06935 [Rhizomicrobium sp.]|nr:hypothetical protein [Rhizomicrobium sp.]